MFGIDVLFAGGGISASAWKEVGLSVKQMRETDKKARECIRANKTVFFTDAVLGEEGDSFESSGLPIQASPPCASVSREGKKLGCDTGETKVYTEILRILRDLHDKKLCVPFLLVESTEGSRIAWQSKPSLIQRMAEGVCPLGYNLNFRCFSSLPWGPLDRPRLCMLFTPRIGLNGRDVMFGENNEKVTKKKFVEAYAKANQGLIVVDTRRQQLVHGKGTVSSITPNSKLFLKGPKKTWQELGVRTLKWLWGCPESYTLPQNPADAIKILGQAQPVHLERYLAKRIVSACQEGQRFHESQHTSKDFDWESVESYPECGSIQYTESGHLESKTWTTITRFVSGVPPIDKCTFPSEKRPPQLQKHKMEDLNAQVNGYNARMNALNKALQSRKLSKFAYSFALNPQIGTKIKFDDEVCTVDDVDGYTLKYTPFKSGAKQKTIHTLEGWYHIKAFRGDDRICPVCERIFEAGTPRSTFHSHKMACEKKANSAKRKR